LINRLQAEFDAKCREFDSMRDKLAANHSFLQGWYQQMQAKLEAKNA